MNNELPDCTGCAKGRHGMVTHQMGTKQHPTVDPTNRLQSLKEEARKRIVDRFLGWSLPENFNPDCGITFEKISNMIPIGTNLLDAMQAEEMVRDILGDEIEKAFTAGAKEERAKNANYKAVYEDGFAAGKEEAVREIMEFLKAEKSTYSEDVAKRERDVYDHLILCLKEESPAPITH